jgi:hypothetical protein
MKKSSRTLIKEMRELLDCENSILENFLIPEDYQDDSDEETPFDEEIPADENPDIQDEPESNEESPISDDVSSEIKPLIDNIRKIALQGIAKLAERPETEEYDLLKRIWTLTDKKKETDKDKK